MSTKAKKPRPDYLRALQDPQDVQPQMALPGVAPAPAVVPDIPQGLSEIEQKTWNELLAEAPEQVKQELNKIIFEALVRATIQFRDASANVTKYGAVIKSPSGYPIQSPYVSIQNKQAALIRQLSAELGLTLASRLRAKAKGKKPTGASRFEGLKSLED